jgi:hypothetical protein
LVIGSLAALGVRGALAGHDPEESGQQTRPGEASEFADLGGEAGGRERVDAAETAQARDHGGMTGAGDRLLEFTDQRAATTGEQLDCGEVVRERGLRAAFIEAVRAQPAHVLGGPRVSGSRVALVVAQQELR